MQHQGIFSNLFYTQGSTPDEEDGATALLLTLIDMTRRLLPAIFAIFLVVFLSLQAYWFLPAFLRRPRLFSAQQSLDLNRPSGVDDIYTSRSFIDEQSGCPILPGIQDILVIIKSSAVVVENLLSAHLNTTLRCIPNFVLYSDLEEEVDGHHVYDALQELDLNSQVSNDDLDLYRRLQLQGRAGLTSEELDTSSTAVRNLDKFKYFPIMEKALQYKPDAKWYIFIDTKTYIFWPTLIQWLAQFDYGEAQYIGDPSQHQDQVFAQGDSGIILSRLALSMASEHREHHRAEYNEFVPNECTGDCLLGKLLQNAGVPLRPWSWPILQDDSPLELDHVAKVSKNRNAWCYPVASYGHLTPVDINNLWLFERGELLNVSAELNFLSITRSSHLGADFPS